MSDLDLHLVILAAGRGTRMRNRLPKVLHKIAGRSLIGHVVSLGTEVKARTTTVVLAPDMDQVAAEVEVWNMHARTALQREALGTGHAVRAAMGELPETGTIIVLFGDTPLITVDTIETMFKLRQEADTAVVVMGMRPPDPHGYGRLKFDAAGDLIAIVEHVHADEDLRRTGICNSGVMAIDAAKLRELIDAVPRQSENGEYYLTDIVAAANERAWRCRALEVPYEQGHGVNSQAQLADANHFLQTRLRGNAMNRGVVMSAPDTVQMAFDTHIEPGAEIEPYVVFGPGVHVASGAIIRSFSHLEGAVVRQHAIIGPYARLREGSEIGEAARIGNFVETKKAVIGKGAKANHLTYLGDCSIGESSNIGAGTITCNYDGYNKAQTEIGAHVFIGSNSALIAPLSIGDHAFVAAGSTLTSEVPSDALAIARGKQYVRPGGGSELRKRFQQKKTKP